ncbi:MAG TPA: terminase family protein [Patescibacteria group bacterium]|nr:terminase family protein [Patescibacteria group bacterium]
MKAKEKKDLLIKGFTPDEIQQLEIQQSPSLWAETYLYDPEKPGKSLQLRSYQKDILECKSKKKVLRLGRRSGKSICLCIESLYKAFITENTRVLICTPYKIQTRNLWKDGFQKLIKGNKLLESSIIRMGQNPYLIEFKNGARIMGLTAGSSTGNKGGSIRGSSADHLIMDEIDYMGEEAIQSIMAITATNKNTTLTISSTPTGRREFFYNACTNKNLGFQEFYFPSSSSPEWTSIEQAKKLGLPLHESQEYVFRNMYPEDVFIREYMAVFGEESQGVFKHKYIDAALVKYDPDSEVADSMGFKWFCGAEQNEDNLYSMGVDWNGTKVGTQIVITEYCRVSTNVNYVIEDDNGKTIKQTSTVIKKYRVFYRESVSMEEMTQLESIHRIIELTKKFKIDHIYVDNGFGTCVAPDTLIYTNRGVKPISNIIIGDLVMTKNGTFERVLDTITRKDIKDSYKLIPSKCLATTASFCHPFLTYRSSNRFKDKNINEGNLVWRQCSEIDIKKDFIAISKTKNLENKTSDIIDLYQLLKNVQGLKHDKMNIWLSSSYKIKDRNYLSAYELSKICSTSKIMITRIRSKLRNKLKLTEHQMRIYKKNKNALNVLPEIIKLPRYIDILSEDFQRIYGWFLSEGNCNTNSIEISQKVGNHTEEINSLKKSISNIFGYSFLSEYIKKEVRRIVISSKLISIIFETLGGKYCYNKFIHPEFMKHPKSLGVFFNSIILGDGSKVKNKIGYCISLTSSSLIFQLRQILIDNGILPSINFLGKRSKEHNDQWLLQIFGTFEIMKKFNNFTKLPLKNTERKTRNKYIEIDNYFLVPIRKLEKIESCSGLVDIKVDNEHSFCGNGVVLHNTNIEELKLYGKKFPESDMNRKLVAIDFASKISIFDPYSKEEVDKAMKPFTVNNAVTCLERGELILPDIEDEKVKLIGQMREYRIEKISTLGIPRYSEDNDHILDAFMLSLLAFQMEYSTLIRLAHTSQIAISNKPTLLMRGLSEVQDRTTSLKKDKLQEMGVPKRQPAFGTEKYHSDSRGGHMDYEDLYKTSPTTSTPFTGQPLRSSWNKINAPTRTNF